MEKHSSGKQLSPLCRVKVGGLGERGDNHLILILTPSNRNLAKSI